MTRQLSDPEIRAIYEVAYQHAKTTFGYFKKPRLVIGVVPHKLKTHFYFDEKPYSIHIHRTTRDDIYSSFLHELTHAYFEYCEIRHKGVFAEYCKKVGGCYANYIS